MTENSPNSDEIVLQIKPTVDFENSPERRYAWMHSRNVGIDQSHGAILMWNFRAKDHPGSATSVGLQCQQRTTDSRIWLDYHTTDKV